MSQRLYDVFTICFPFSSNKKTMVLKAETGTTHLGSRLNAFGSSEWIKDDSNDYHSVFSGEINFEKGKVLIFAYDEKTDTFVLR